MKRRAATSARPERGECDATGIIRIECTLRAAVAPAERILTMDPSLWCRKWATEPLGAIQGLCQFGESEGGVA